MLDTRDISAAEQQQLGLALRGNGVVNAPLPFTAGLCGENSYGAFAWRDLPGLHNRETFKAQAWFRDFGSGSVSDFAGASFGSAHGGSFCFAKGTTGFWNNGTVELGGNATGAHQGLLGSIFTTGQDIVIASGTEAVKTFSPAGHTGITKPVEINGFIFFTSCVAGNEVVGYLPPPLFAADETFGETEQEQRRVQHFATEHLGTAGRVGLWRGIIVLATTRGVWEIKALSDGMGYGLGQQIEAWNLSPEVQFGITLSDIWALDGGTLLRRGEGSAEIVGNCGYEILSSDGRQAILSAKDNHFAVSNGSDFEEFGGELGGSVVGMLFSHNGKLHSTERSAWTDRQSVWLSTTWAHFPSAIAIEEVFTDPSVEAVSVATETGSYSLSRSLVTPSLWRAGYSGHRLRVSMRIPINTAISQPILRLRRRTTV